jgi:hypothetical protein
VAALRGAFLPQRVDRSAHRQGQGSSAIQKAIHAQEDAKAAKEKALQVVEKLCAMRLAKAAEIVESGIGETLSYYSMPREH